MDFEANKKHLQTLIKYKFVAAKAADWEKPQDVKVTIDDLKEIGVANDPTHLAFGLLEKMKSEGFLDSIRVLDEDYYMGSEDEIFGFSPAVYIVVVSQRVQRETNPVLRMTMSRIGDVYVNDELLYSPTSGSPMDLFLTYAIQTAKHGKIYATQIENFDQGKTQRSLSSLVNDLFADSKDKAWKELFFPRKSQGYVFFQNPVTEEMVRQHKEAKRKKKK